MRVIPDDVLAPDKKISLWEVGGEGALLKSLKYIWYISELQTTLSLKVRLRAENPAARVNWGQLATDITGLNIIFSPSQQPAAASAAAGEQDGGRRRSQEWNKEREC